MLRTVDTNVLVLDISTVKSLEDTKFWVTFGTGRLTVPAHEISN